MNSNLIKNWESKKLIHFWGCSTAKFPSGYLHQRLGDESFTYVKKFEDEIVDVKI